MISRGVYYIVVALLFIMGISLMIYEHVTFDVPWFPSSKNIAWDIEAKISFNAPYDESVPVKVSLAIPESQPGFKIVSENTASPNYGLYFNDRAGHTRAEWSNRAISGHQILYYRIGILADNSTKNSMVTVPKVARVVLEEPYLTAINQIGNAAWSRSSDPMSFTQAVFQEIRTQEENARLLLTKFTRQDLLVKLLNLHDIPARIIRVVKLEDGRRNQHLIPYIAIFDPDNSYRIIDPESAKEPQKGTYFIWESNAHSLLEISGGEDSQVVFSIIRNNVSEKKAFAMRQNSPDAVSQDKFDLSVNALPIEEQAVFKNILLLPIGVFIVVFLRIIVGIKTSGTFMPVLIATAFLQTNLAVGLIGFLTIVGIGLIIRSWLSYLNLLLVARISTVIITVIAIIGTLSFITYKVGLTDGIKITFFPMIILSWTIERMSVLWEEEGYKEVLIQGGGSMFVAVMAYLAMSSPAIQHLSFNFLGLMLVILSGVLIMGNYTGYRLTELKRFRPLAEEIAHPVKEGELEADRLKRETKAVKKEA